ncbi:MAG: DUF1858 domain-containing protein [Deltaproteobacteria bacterium]|nr:DUF1858 domain-containing protein [Deltaproteobacteria bacterium]
MATTHLHDITPDTKVGTLLEQHPEVEEVLIGMSPEFRRLRNPVLRRTLARIATLRQVAGVGGVPLGDLVNRLREAAGMGSLDGLDGAGGDGDGGAGGGRPDWVRVPPDRTFDAREVIEAGGHPLEEVMRALRDLGPAQVFELVTPFVPAPLIDVAKGKGFRAWSAPAVDGVFRTYFVRL